MTSVLKSQYYTPCMKKLDKLSWEYGSTYSAYGCQLGLRANTAEALAEISDQVPKWIKPTSESKVDRMLSYIKGGRNGRLRNFNLLYFDHALAGKSHDNSVIQKLFTDGMEIAIAENATERIFLHAGAVSWKGKGILIPGESHSGKTTLVSQFLKLGATYCSDEYAVIDRNGHVEPVDRPLHVREPNTEIQHIVSPSALGAQSSDKAVPISLIVLTEYQENAEIEPECLSVGETVLSLMKNAFTAHSQPEATLDYLETLARQAYIVKSKRGEASSSAQTLIQLMERNQ